MSNWTYERIGALKAMWTAGYTAREIAKALSTVHVTFSRNAVIGKAHRLKLPARGVSTRKPQPPNRPGGAAVRKVA